MTKKVKNLASKKAEKRIVLETYNQYVPEKVTKDIKMPLSIIKLKDDNNAYSVSFSIRK